MLLAKSKGALGAYGRLFESRQMEKRYIAVVKGAPQREEWICRLRLSGDTDEHGRIVVDAEEGKEAETRFHVLKVGTGTSLIEARPVTGRTHQIRVHLAESGYPVVGDELYGSKKTGKQLGLRAVALCYRDPFTNKRVGINAATTAFLREYGFDRI